MFALLLVLKIQSNNSGGNAIGAKRDAFISDTKYFLAEFEKLSKKRNPTSKRKHSVEPDDDDITLLTLYGMQLFSLPITSLLQQNSPARKAAATEAEVVGI